MGTIASARLACAAGRLITESASALVSELVQESVPVPVLVLVLVLVLDLDWPSLLRVVVALGVYPVLGGDGVVLDLSGTRRANSTLRVSGSEGSASIRIFCASGGCLRLAATLAVLGLDRCFEVGLCVDRGRSFKFYYVCKSLSVGVLSFFGTLICLLHVLVSPQYFVLCALTMHLFLLSLSLSL
jgi:hypothetical protein